MHQSVLAARIISPIGLILNFVFLFVVVRVKSMRTVINVYLSNLAVADFLFLLMALIFSTPVGVVNSIVTQIVWKSLLDTCSNASFCFVTAIAVDRFSAVHHPITFRASNSKTRAAKISAGLWILAAITGVTGALLGRAEFASVSPTTVFNCYKAYWILQLIFFASNFAVTAFMYIYIGIKLCRQTPGTQQHPRRIGKVVCMMVINTAVFFLSNLFGIILEANVIEAKFGGSPLTLSGSILVTHVCIHFGVDQQFHQHPCVQRHQLYLSSSCSRSVLFLKLLPPPTTRCVTSTAAAE